MDSADRHLTATLSIDRRSSRENSWRLAIGLAVGVKVVIILGIGAGYRLFSYCEPCRVGNFLVERKPRSFSSALSTWDGQHYLYLSQRGYQPRHPSDAFYPLYPTLIRVVAPILGNRYLLVGHGLTLVFSIALVKVLFDWLSRAWNAAIARRSVYLLLAFPTAFYLHLMYTESLFLLLVVTLFYAYARRSLWALVPAILLPLTRFQGVLIAFPFTAAVLFPDLFDKSTKRKQLALMVVASIGIGFCLYLGWMKLATGDAFSGFIALRSYVTRYSIANLLNPTSWFIGNFVSIQYSLMGFNTSIIDRLYFVFFLTMLKPMYKYLTPLLFIYALAVGLLTAFSGYFMSYPRYLLAAFPMFIALAKILGKRWWLAALPMGAAQLVLAIMHGLNYWVA